MGDQPYELWMNLLKRGLQDNVNKGIRNVEQIPSGKTEKVQYIKLNIEV